jgi:hypothetical protein
MKLLTKIRAWKNRIFPDWLWDILVGAFCAVIGLLGLFIQINWLVVVVPFVVTAWNQLVINRVFEPKDAVLRMVVPGVMYIIMAFK